MLRSLVFSCFARSLWVVYRSARKKIHKKMGRQEDPWSCLPVFPSSCSNRYTTSLCALLLAAAVAGCSVGSQPAPSEGLQQRFPAHAARVLQGIAPLVANKDGFALGPADDARVGQHRDGLEIALPNT
jgi:hypothetical protein